MTSEQFSNLRNYSSQKKAGSQFPAYTTDAEYITAL